MFFSKCVHQGRHAERKAVIGRDHKFVLTQPAKIPPISLAASTTSLDRYQSRTCGRGTRSTSSIWNALCGATNVAPSHIKLDGEKVGRKHVSARMKKYGTSTAFSPKLKDGNIRLSVDSKGSWRDNVFVESLWLSIKYEEVYLKADRTMTEAKGSVVDDIDLYQRRRPDSSLDGVPTDRFYYQNLPLSIAA